MSDKKAILLTEWGEANFDPPPSLHTLVRMGRQGRIVPAPQKHGGVWYVDDDARVPAEPPPQIRRSAALPQRTELYRHFDVAGRLLYVGISLSTAHRLGQHQLTGRWADKVASVTIERFATRAEALAAELAAIQNEHPLHNKKGVVSPAAKVSTAYLATSEPEGSRLERYFRERGYVPGKGRA